MPDVSGEATTAETLDSTRDSGTGPVVQCGFLVQHLIAGLLGATWHSHLLPGSVRTPRKLLVSAVRDVRLCAVCNWLTIIIVLVCCGSTCVSRLLTLGVVGGGGGGASALPTP